MFVSRFPFFMWYRPDLGDCLLGAGLLMEASTPFVSARAILANLGEYLSLKIACSASV